MLDLEAFDRCPMRDHALKQGAQLRDVPLPVSEVVNMTSLGLAGARAEGLVEGAIGRSDIQVSIENDECAGYGLNNVAGSNIGHRFFCWSNVGHGRCSSSIAVTRLRGKQIFKSKCASCHTLADAGATGTIGPNLDQLKPSFPVAQNQVIHGGGAMPAFKGTLTDAQIKAVAKYVAANAGK